MLTKVAKIKHPVWRQRSHKENKSAILSFQLLALQTNHFVRQARHPKTFFNSPVDGLEGVLSACINKPQETFDNRRGSSVALEIYERVTVTGTSNLRWLLRVVG